MIVHGRLLACSRSRVSLALAPVSVQGQSYAWTCLPFGLSPRVFTMITRAVGPASGDGGSTFVCIPTTGWCLVALLFETRQHYQLVCRDATEPGLLDPLQEAQLDSIAGPEVSGSISPPGLGPSYPLSLEGAGTGCPSHRPLEGRFGAGFRHGPAFLGSHVEFGRPRTILPVTRECYNCTSEASSVLVCTQTPTWFQCRTLGGRSWLDGPPYPI